MNLKKYALIVSALSVLLLASACGANANSNSNATPSGTIGAAPSESAGQSPSGSAEAPASESAPASDAQDEEILIVIDQTQKPIEGHSFDFIVKKLPEGYALSEMSWKSDKSDIVNTTQQAIEHGGNGEDGFYISGDGQFMGFFYPDKMKDEEGEVGFVFKNADGKELTWKKKITLK